MKVRVRNENTISAFLRIRGEWLLTEGNDIIVIREVQYTHIKPENELEEQDDAPLPLNTKRYRRRSKKKEETEKFYVTKLVVNGYNPDGKFVGTYNDEWCERILGMQDDKHSSFSIYNLRKRWENIVLQKDALLQYEKELEMEKEAEKTEPEEPSTFAELGAKVFNGTPDPICNCDARDMPTYKEDGKTWCPQCGYEVK